MLRLFLSLSLLLTTLSVIAADNGKNIIPQGSKERKWMENQTKS